MTITPFVPFLVFIHRVDNNTIEIASAISAEPLGAQAAVAQSLLEQGRTKDIIIGVFGQNDVSAMQQLLNDTQALADQATQQASDAE